MHKLDIQEWAEETGAILEQARKALLESQQPEVRALAEHLPEPGGTDEKPVSLAFAGPYSSGKSSMLRALTGRDDIATGAGITTEQIQIFDWNGVEVVDTPGINTQLRPDHDLRSYEAISRADLLVFVITNELFDSHIGAHFRKLAIDREKGHEMILVINKMGRAGNTSQTREVITEDLRKPLAPFSPEELRITFTDALSALEADQERDPEIAAMLRREANIEELIRNLNDIVAEKGLYARQTTTLYAINEVMQNAIVAEPAGDPDVDALILIYNQNIWTMEESRSRLRQAVNNAIDGAVQKVQKAGADCANSFDLEMPQEEWEKAAEETDGEVERLWEVLVQQIERACAEVVPFLGDRLEELHSSHRFKNLLQNLDKRATGHDVDKILGIARDTAEQLSKLSRWASINKSAIQSGATGLSRFSGSPGHNTVRSIGRVMGHSFRPWGAVKIARSIGTAGDVLAVARVAIGMILQVKTDRDEEQRAEEARRGRQTIRSHYSQAATEMGAEAETSAQQFINEMLSEPLEDLRQYADQLNHARREQDWHMENLCQVSEQAKALIAKMHTIEPGDIGLTHQVSDLGGDGAGP